MSSVVYVDPAYTPPPPAVSIWNGYDLVWNGVDGSVWNLHNLAGGVVVVADELEGLLFGQFDTYASTSPARAGRRRRGSRALERKVQIPVLVWTDAGSDAWVAKNRAWWDSVAPDQVGTLDVSYQGRKLSIDLYFDPQEALTLSRDPAKTGGWALYMMEFLAEDPYWYGEPVIRSWGQATQSAFFPTDPGSPTSADPLLFISPGRSLDSAVMQNPGKVAAWPVWVATSNTGSVSVTMSVADGPISSTVPNGKTLVVDTDPGRGTAFLGHLEGSGTNIVFVPETDVGGLLSEYDPRPVPPGSDVPIAFTMTGNGTVSCQILPRYYIAL